MKNLAEILKINVGTIKLSSRLQRNITSPSQQLYEGFVTGKFSSDEEAARHLYKRTSKKNSAYNKAKHRAIDKVLELFLQTDASHILKSEYEKAFYRCSKNVLAAQIMNMSDMRLSAVSVLKKSLAESQKYFLSDCSLKICRLLRHNAGLTGSKKKFYEFDRQAKHYEKVLNAEMKSEEYAQRIILEFAKSSVVTDVMIKNVERNYKKLQELHHKFPSHVLRMNMYRVGVRYFNLIGEYHHVIRVCNQCEIYLHNNSHLLQQARLAEMSLYKLDASLFLRDNTSGLRYAKDCEKYFNPEKSNWMIFQEYYFLLCMHTGNYENALEIFYKVTGHQKFSNLGQERIEKWKIFEAYLNYALPSTLPKKSFNLFKFLNEVPVFSKDKKGYNFAIYAAQILLLIEINDMEKLIDLSEKFQSYCKRHVNRKKDFRRYYFSKLLMLLFKYDFDAEKCKKIGAKFYNKLISYGPDNMSGLEMIEIIPYDIIWNNLPEKLKSNKKAACGKQGESVSVSKKTEQKDFVYKIVP